MAIYNSYLYPYPQGYQAAANPTNPMASTNNNGIIWVQGENGAKSFLVAPGTTVQLMDSETKKFYIKSVDQSGMPMPLRTFTYEEVTEKSGENKEEYATKSDLATLKADILAKFKAESGAKDE